MASGAVNLPPGFELDEQNLPEGFVLDRPVRRSPMEMVGRQVGLTARAGIEGLASFPLAITDAPVQVKRSLGLPSGQKASEVLHEGLTKLGLPEAETGTERVVQDITSGMSGTGGVVKLSNLAGKAVPAMSNILSGGTASGVSAGAREAGLPEWAQTLAGLSTMLRPGKSSQNPVKLQTFNQAHEAGYKFPPSAIDRGLARETLESVGGKAAIKQDTALHNQQITNKLAKQGAGLGTDEVLTEQTLAAARDRLAEPYKQIASLSPEASKALSIWKDANAQAKLHWNDYQRNRTASAHKQYERFNSRAEGAQSTMEDEALRTGNPDLVQKLREARVKIAQNWDVDRALNIGTGDVRADQLGRLLNSRGAQGMSGPLGVIAKTQQAFPQYMGEAAKTPTPGVNQLASLGLGSLFGLEGYHAMGVRGGLAGAGVGLALPQVSRGARALSMNAFQRPRSAEGVPLSALTSYLATEQTR